MDYLLVMLATVAVIFGGKAFWDWKKNRTPQLDLDELEEERAEYLQENFEKAVADFKFIEESQGTFRADFQNAKSSSKFNC